MQIFILGRTMVEQRRFAQMMRERLGLPEQALPIYSVTPCVPAEALQSAARDMGAELAGVPLSAYLHEPCNTLFPDPTAAYRQWREWFATEHLVVVGADTLETFIRLAGHDEHNAVILLESDLDAGPGTAGVRALDDYVESLRLGPRSLPIYRVSAQEFVDLTTESSGETTAMYEGPSEAFIELWAA
jgi:hypothetical protein